MAQRSIITISSWFGPIRIDPDPELAPYRPTRKVRGRHRYYRALHRDAEHFAVSLDGWFDYMHWHADWPGLGNLRWRERREHLRAVFRMFERLTYQVADWPVPHQVWLSIDAADSSHDAVYLHTANPNQSNYPNPFTGVVWGSPIPPRLTEFMTDPRWQFGRIDDHWTHFLLRPRPAA